jgi:hypothetical protein
MSKRITLAVAFGALSILSTGALADQLADIKA